MLLLMSYTTTTNTPIPIITYVTQHTDGINGGITAMMIIIIIIDSQFQIYSRNGAWKILKINQRR